jgi:hypothetical protein
MNNDELDTMIANFTAYVMEQAEITEEYRISDYDLSRVYLDVGNNIDNYTIRMWDMRIGYIRYSLFRQEDNHGIEILSSKTYFFETDISEEEFNEYFVSCALRYGFNYFETSSIEAENYATYIIDNFILPITEWNEEIIKENNHKTVFFWYLNYLYYLNFDKDNAVGRYTDFIYQFFDSIEL